MTSDNLTQIIVACIAAVTAILSARFSARKPLPVSSRIEKHQEELDQLYLKLTECEQQRDAERELYYRQKKKRRPRRA